MDAATPAKADSLEVTGVSRSGRVRKKSSKLVDFQSPDDIEATRAKRPVPIKSATSKPAATSPIVLSTVKGSEIRSPPRIKMEHEIEIISPSAVNVNIDDVPVSQSTLNEMEIQSDDGDPNTLLIDTTVKKSTYMTEKSTKKKIFKNGKFMTKKPQRKDKGKSRFTAYMLWAKDVRSEMLYTYPDLDFSTISRRLGEMWANVPSNEKYNWRRRAKRLAAKSKEKAKIPASKPAAIPVTSKFLNRNSQVVRTKKPVAVEKVTTNVESQATPVQQRVTPTNRISPVASSQPTKISGTSPVDVAAHLKLLGDSLTIIGQRLKEHEGQIAVSGSLSVLLDSLLCSVAPLMCLAIQIPEIGQETTDEIKRTMAQTLDNIAYVMPGL